jgi:1-acyl-sn-glycerol-3-phosphate acyltransferase
MIGCISLTPISTAFSSVATGVGGRFLSRDDLARWPVIGKAAQAAGTIFVDRSHSTSGAAAIRSIRKALKAGHTVIVFPEGTTFAGDHVREFRPGAFVGLHSLDMEILPVGLAYESGVEFVDESFIGYLARVGGRRRTRVSVVVGEPGKPEKDGRRTAELYRQRVQGLVVRARERLVAMSDHGEV